VVIQVIMLIQELLKGVFTIVDRGIVEILLITRAVVGEFLQNVFEGYDVSLATNCSVFCWY